MSLRSKTISSLKWTAIERAGVQGLTFIVQIILARILLPEEFGIVATVAIILALASVLTDGGLGAALVQNPDIDRKDISTVFFMNVGVSLATLVLLTLLAPMIASYFREPVLERIVPALGLGVCFAAFGQTQLQMLQRNMEFKRLVHISIPSNIVAGATGIAMALTGFGVWALVGQRLSRSATFSVCAWRVCSPDWRPRLEFSVSSLKKMAGFSLSILSVTMLNRLAKNLHGLVIAKAFSMQELGFYNRAQSFQKQPINALASSLQKVFFPVFSKIQNDNSRIRNALRVGVPLLAFSTIPAMFWLIAVAEPLIRVVLTDKWLPSVPFLQVVPLLGIVYPLATLKMNVIKSKGNSHLIFWLGVTKQSIQLVTLFFTWRYGIMWMILGQLGASLVNMLLNDFIASRLITYSIREQLTDWIPYAGCSAMALLVVSLAPVTVDSQLLILLFQTALFFATYLAACWLFSLDGLRMLQIPANRLGQLLSNKKQVESE